MGFMEYLLRIIRSLLWPPMGVILFEEQILQWIFATGKVYFSEVAMPNLIIVFAVYAIIMFVVFERRPMHHAGRGIHHGIGRIIGFILRLLFVILFSWAMLIYGALAGGLRGEGPENDPRGMQNITFRRHYFHFIDVSNTFARLSWHFRFGRWLFRMAYMLIGHIGLISRNPHVHRTIARAIALFIIIYRAWEIPYLLTH